MPQNKKTKKKTGRAGGFIAQNSGQIDNCYSLVKVIAKKQVSAGFVAENTGHIKACIANKRIKKLDGGFRAINTGTINSCYFFHNKKEDSKKIEKLSDTHRAQQRRRFTDENEHLRSSKNSRSAALSNKENKPKILKFSNHRFSQTTKAKGINLVTKANPDFDLEDIWEYTDNEKLLRFISEKWCYDLSKKPSKLYEIAAKKLQGQTGQQTVTAAGGGVVDVMPDMVIRTPEELYDFARRVNEGDRKLINGYIRLENDINLKGKKWTPIGFDLTYAFCGVFDGGGHAIRNFVIKDKKIKDKGFFGYLKGEVYNLDLDLKIKGGIRAGGLAAYCEGGTIGCCSAIIDITVKGSEAKEGYFGGLVGTNSGRIFHSYAAGRFRGLLIPWWWGLLLALLMFLTLSLPMIDGLNDITVFPPPPVDPGVIQIAPPDPRIGRNFVSFEFEREIKVDLGTGNCLFHFRNPPESNHDIVVQLQMTDYNAVLAMGSTGRTAEEQQRLGAHPGYDPETYRTVLAESGAIPVGYMLESLFLSAQPNGARLTPGEYPAIVFLIFYDRSTHARAMLESQLPVTIVVN